jgi:hypothetical protein
MKKRYTFYLDEECVEAARRILKPRGAKLSPVINKMLLEWITREEFKTQE